MKKHIYIQLAKGSIGFDSVMGNWPLSIQTSNAYLLDTEILLSEIYHINIILQIQNDMYKLFFAGLFITENN